MGPQVRLARRVRSFSANPFVVFADVAIALAFIFALSAVALSKLLSDAARAENQDGFRNRMVTAVFGKDARTVPVTNAEDQKVLKDAFWIVDRLNRTLGRIEQKGSFQRIRLTGMYDPMSADLKPGRKPYVYRLVRVVRDEMAKRRVSYLHLHGVTSGVEDLSNARLAGERANRLFDDLVDQNLISAKPMGNKFADASRINRIYVVPYGKPGLYRDAPGPGSARVDFVLYFGDVERS
jgi:hypothetical protein